MKFRLVESVEYVNIIRWFKRKYNAEYKKLSYDSNNRTRYVYTAIKDKYKVVIQRERMGSTFIKEYIDNHEVLSKNIDKFNSNKELKAEIEQFLNGEKPEEDEIEDTSDELTLSYYGWKDKYGREYASEEDYWDTLE